MTETDATVRPRAVHLLEYLAAVRSIKEQPVRDVAQYQDKRWWAGDIPEHPSCMVTATGEGPWLRVAKAPVPAMPTVPAAIAPHLVTGATDPRREPAFAVDFAERFIARHVAPVAAKLAAERSQHGEEEVTDDHDEEAQEIVSARAEAEQEAARLLTLLRDYVNGSWRAWAEQALIALDARALYDYLFELRQRLQRESAFFELVWGHGILSWVAPDGSRVQHPLVTTQVQLEFDAETGAISVEPDALLPHHLDIDLLQGLRLDGFGLLLDVREGFRQSPVGPFDPEARDLYGRLLAPLGQDGEVRDATRPPTPQAVPVITASWILMVRRRSTMYQRFFTEMREAIESGQANVAAPIVSVVASEPGKLDQAALASYGDQSWQRAAERLLMPLPTNPEQEQVAQRLAEHRGVTVQGPPGTGKTHTIANLISHLVGHGKRVLVTSQKEQALAVLRDKIPESIRDLSVAVLGSSTTSRGQLRQSVQAINEKAVSLDRPTARQRISRLDAALTQAQRDVGALRTRISQVSERETETYTAGVATSTPSTLGHWLATGEAELSFIPDVIQPGTASPLTATEFADLFQLARAITPADRDKARCLLPVVGNLPAPAELMGIRSELLEIRDRLAETESAVQDRVALERLSPDELTALTEAVDQASKRLEQLEQPWLATIRGQLRNPAFAGMWRDQLQHLQAAIGDLAMLRNQTLGHQIALPDSVPSRELQQLLGQLRDRLAAGKGVSKLLQKDLHRVRESCLVDEEPLRTAADVDLAIAELRARSHRGQMVRRWNDAIGTVGGPVLTIGTAYPEYELAGHVDGLSGAFGWEGGDWQALAARLSAAGVRVSPVPSSGELAALAGTLRIAALHIREKELSGRLDSLARHLTDGAAQPTASELWTLLRDTLAAGDWQRWGLAVDETRRLISLTADVARFDQLTARLGTVTPIWARKLWVSSGTETDIGTAEKALGAWEWRQAETWLQSVISADDPATLQGQLEGKLKTVGALTADLAAESAWLGLAERLTDAERRALTAWTDAVRRIGKGTGKYAAHWRSVAQQAMHEAQGAVPVWIMPMHRVVESFGADSARFDVVIVDESSQCDLFSLAALAIADKAVIVGDDQQISPQMVGTEESAVHELIDQYIADIPQAALLDIKTSLYDMAKMRFPGVIMLREHFRCLPEIIEFSNQLCYNGTILPLREQPTDRTWRSVIDVQVPDGFREKGTDTNPAEADFIVGKITELCGDPRYDGKTFGVISLLGDGQAQLIESKLIEALGEQEMERRQIRCGNAYHFQGDERDVIFVSLVAAVGEGRRLGAMTREPDRQRINVAASRARDQLWCVRSISLDDLHPDDVRGLLIRHCQEPARITEAEATASFDSDFERDVYRKIIVRGYRVRTQYKVGRYRIDMVIEGAGGRLALELDGDAYHGPDRWDADRQRQAILERLGWTFHRIRGSAYYRRPEESLSSLWERLESLGIYPAGDGPRILEPPASSTAPAKTVAPVQQVDALGSLCGRPRRRSSTSYASKISACLEVNGPRYMHGPRSEPASGRCVTLAPGTGLASRCTTRRGGHAGRHEHRALGAWRRGSSADQPR